jgi:hypothetical protein
MKFHDVCLSTIKHQKGTQMPCKARSSDNLIKKLSKTSFPHPIHGHSRSKDPYPVNKQFTISLLCVSFASSFFSFFHFASRF